MSCRGQVNNSPSLSTEEIAQVVAGASEEDLAECCAVDGIVGGYVCTEVGCEYSDGERCGPPPTLELPCGGTLLVLPNPGFGTGSRISTGRGVWT